MTSGACLFLTSGACAVSFLSTCTCFLTSGACTSKRDIWSMYMMYMCMMCTMYMICQKSMYMSKRDIWSMYMHVQMHVERKLTAHAPDVKKSYLEHVHVSFFLHVYVFFLHVHVSFFTYVFLTSVHACTCSRCLFLMYMLQMSKSMYMSRGVHAPDVQMYMYMFQMSKRVIKRCQKE